MELSIIVPLFNEEDVLILFYNSLMESMNKIDVSYEIIFIDDGSSDKTNQILQNLSNKNLNIKFISFTRNFGHQNAIWAGLEYSSGNAVIMMDGDLQHPPELIHQLYEHWDSGYRIVQTVRNDVNTPKFKKFSSIIFYKFLNMISELPIDNSTADFRLIDRKVVSCLLQFKESDLFIRGLIPWLGFKTKFIHFNVKERLAGQSKYTLVKMLKFAMTGITSFSTFPLKIASYSGILIASLSFLVGLYSIYTKLVFNETVQGWTSLMVGVFFIGGIILVSLGILGEYIGKLFLEVKKRPKYLINHTSIESEK